MLHLHCHSKIRDTALCSLPYITNHLRKLQQKSFPNDALQKSSQETKINQEKNYIFTYISEMLH